MAKVRQLDKSISVSKFAVVGVIIAIILLGSLYFVKYRGESVRREQAIAEAEAEIEATNKGKEENESAISEPQDDETNDGEELVATNDDLPLTGLSGSLAGAMMIGCLSASAAYYLCSRRALGYYL